jgi:uncharacterized 2Fe-2S/4Fe-4S cluster protein (DUF4445 family)
MTMAGNTIMTHFFLDLPVQHLPRAPYIPVAHSPEPVRAAELGLALNPHARVVVFPNAGSYVGGDIVAGILAAGMHRQAEPCMLIDVGTNVEIVLGCREWLMVGAGAAGPALEGDIAAIGMSAREGAIAGVSIRHGTIPDDYEVLMTTIGDTAPRGICGSGMIELIAELFRNGLIDGQGKLKPIPGRTVSSGNGAGFVIAEAASGQLVITELEIANFIRSKAALFAALQVMTGAVGLRFSDLSTVQVAGAFGQWINVDKAVSIGMLPDIDRKKFRVLGNSSLAGATQYLGDRESKGEIRRIAEMITYRELNEDGDFMRHLTAGLFLPHTNPDALKG